MFLSPTVDFEFPGLLTSKAKKMEDALKVLGKQLKTSRDPWRPRDIPEDQAGTMYTKQRPMETKEDKQTTLETK